jgi:hypothetical protein
MDWWHDVHPNFVFCDLFNQHPATKPVLEEIARTIVDKLTTPIPSQGIHNHSLLDYGKMKPHE